MSENSKMRSPLIPKQRNSIRIGFQRGKTNKEISEKLGIPVKTVQTETKKLKDEGVPQRKQSSK